MRDTHAAMGASGFRGVDIPRGAEHARRPALERVGALAPQLLGVALAAVARLPVNSRIRQRAVVVALSRGFAAINRGDPWFIPFGYEPDCEIYSAAEFRALGLAHCYRGSEGWRELIDAVEEVLPDVRWTPQHLIDLGGRWVVRHDMSGSGRSSGARTHQTWGSVYLLSPRGRIARQDIYWTWEQALAAAGLREGR